ncbi:MAG: hypothetical protein KDC46_15990 [Thermoleophilia bacterium]|nr:hypothetical protein [Thermoleophilia bacterium]
MSAPQTPTAPATLSAAATTSLLDDRGVLRWWQTTAFLEVAGPDAATLLDGLCTQAVERIAPLRARLGLFLDAKAKIIAPAVLHRRADLDDAPRFALETLPELVEPLRAHLAKYRLRAKASVEPTDLATVALVGSHLPEPDPRPDGDWIEVADAPRPTLAFVGSRDACAQITAQHAELAADPDAFEADRIAAAHAWLHDLLPGRMPAEVGGMDHAVALDAGCYLGQEPVARLHYRGHANRSIRRLEADPGSELRPEPGDPAESLALHDASSDDASGRSIGRLTTWARAADGRLVALAMLRREVETDALVRIPGSSSPLRVTSDAPA